MGYYKKHYFINESGEKLSHSANRKHAKWGTVGSTSEERGTDNKKNNTSEYNKTYYEENKEKWKDGENKSSDSESTKSDKSHNDDLFYDKDGNARFGHKDYDPSDPDFARKDGKKIGDSNLTMFTNSNGSTIILGDGIKFSFPPGTKITSAMAKQLADIEKANDGSNKESYVAKMLNAVTGFADKQGLDTNVPGKGDKEEKKSSSKSKKEDSKEEKKSETTKKDQDKDDTWRRTISKYDGSMTKPTVSDAKKANEAANKKGKSTTEYYKKQQKKKSQNYNASTAKHDGMHEDIGSILVKDLF